MKYLRTLPIPAALVINERMWNDANPNLPTLQAQLHANPPHPNCTGYDKPNGSKYLCEMTIDEAGNQAELHVPDDKVNLLTPGEQAQMTDTPTLEVIP